MEGKFVRVVSKRALVFLVLGAVLLGYLGGKLFSLEACPELFILLIALWAVGCIFYLGRIGMFFLNNRGAFLKLEESGISARYGFGKQLQCPLEALSYASVGSNILSLEAGGMIHDISGLANVGELAAWLKEHVPFIIPKEEKDELLIQRTNATQSRKHNLILTVIFVACAAVSLFLARNYLQEKDLTALTSSDLLIFGAWLAGGLLGFVAALICVRKVSKAIRLLAVNHDKLRCLAISKTPLPEGDAIGVFYDGYAVRLTLYADPEDRVYYITEKMNAGYNLEIRKTSQPSADTTEADKLLEQMRDIGFLFGLE